MNNRMNVLEGLQKETSLDLIRLGVHPNDVILAPAKVDTFTALVAMVKGMERLKQFPPYIQSTPFRAYFDGTTIVLVRREQKGNGLRINFSEADRVIRAAGIGIQMYKDAQVHRGEPSPIMGATTGEIHDPGFDGLD